MRSWKAGSLDWVADDIMLYKNVLNPSYIKCISRDTSRASI